MTVWISCIVILMPLLGEAEVASARTGPAREAGIVLATGNAQDAEYLESESASVGATRIETCSTLRCPRQIDRLESMARWTLLVEEPISDFEVNETDETESAPLLDRGRALCGRVGGPVRTWGLLLGPVAAIFGEHVSRGPPFA